LLGCRNLVKSLAPRVRALTGVPEAGAGRVRTVKKLLVVAVLGLSAFAVWRKVQADRAELNLWTEATTADE
jgi:hypothetical protein